MGDSGEGIFDPIVYQLDLKPNSRFTSQHRFVLRYLLPSDILGHSS